MTENDHRKSTILTIFPLETYLRSMVDRMRHLMALSPSSTILHQTTLISNNLLDTPNSHLILPHNTDQRVPRCDTSNHPRNTNPTSLLSAYTKFNRSHQVSLYLFYHSHTPPSSCTILKTPFAEYYSFWTTSHTAWYDWLVVVLSSTCSVCLSVMSPPALFIPNIHFATHFTHVNPMGHIVHPF